MTEPSQQLIQASFIYDAERGRLVWRARPRSDFATTNAWSVWNTKHAGTDAGWIETKGYRVIRFAGKCRKASRLIWKLHYGTDPDRIDHINGRTYDDRIANLRDVSQAVNSQNKARQRNNRSGVSGVFMQRGRWVAQIQASGLKRYLGSFPTVNEAKAARKAAEAAYGFHCNHGRDADRTGTRGE
jgi:hypothetical protein